MNILPDDRVTSYSHQTMATSQSNGALSSVNVMRTPAVVIDNIDDDDALQEHVVRVQRLLMESVDKQLNILEKELEIKHGELVSSEKHRTDVGSVLFSTQAELQRLNKVVAKLSSRVQSSDENKKTLNANVIVLQKELDGVYKKNALLEVKLSNTSLQLAKTQELSQEVSNLNVAATDDIKIHVGIEHKLQCELEAEKTQRRSAEHYGEQQCKKVERLLIDQKKLEARLAAQEDETTLAQREMEKMAEVISQREKAFLDLQRQWKDGLKSMAKRDSTLQLVCLRLEEAVAQTKVLSSDNRILTNAADESESLLVKLESGEARLRSVLLSKEAEIAQMSMEIVRMENENNILRRTDADSSEKLVSMEVKLKAIEKEVISLREKKAVVADTAVQLNSRLREREADTRRLATAADREVEQLDKQFELINSYQDDKVFQLQNINSRIANEIQKLSKEVLDLRSENQRIKKHNQELVQSNEDLFAQKRDIANNLTRRQQETTKFKTKLIELDSGYITKPLEGMVQTLQRELKNSHVRNDDLQGKCVTNQKEAVKVKEAYAKEKGKKQTLENRLVVLDIIKSRTDEEISNLNKEYSNKSNEADGLLLELRRIMPLVDELQQKNRVLENRLAEARLLIEAKDVDLRTANGHMHVEICQLKAERAALKKDRAATDKSINAIERKFAVTRVFYNRKKQEAEYEVRANHYLSKELQNLRQDFSKQQQQIATWTRNTIAKVDVRHNKALAKNAVAQKSLNAPASEEEAQNRGTDLRFRTLESELAQARSENGILKCKIEELARLVIELEKHKAKSTQYKANTAREIASLRRDFEDTQNTLTRARHVAAYIETQFRQYVPEQHQLTYQLPVSANFEPSIMLISLLSSSKSADNSLPEASTGNEHDIMKVSRSGGNTSHDRSDQLEHDKGTINDDGSKVNSHPTVVLPPLNPDKRDNIRTPVDDDDHEGMTGSSRS